ncbi:WecB/TagA/CpsF family glycosyltransferase [Candidatus Peregrinibacteria bacterium]|jgi:N-acetylglucosaminyldiphosphoundecaprenol N-acetyl-beta-D-mannosaminyltransferase|nr:WecB/TagA/CpsF family glycosyltransferase [Candidatus Peregrinibacteria bacterium]MBT4056426.1 WecB/TagA/CpsF family glycosyltransferase [Candidatus Peregrinibacteria bacterium]
MRKKIKILGVEFDTITEKEALEKVEGWLNEKNKRKRVIVTPNPEIILKAENNNRYRKILNKADLSIPDGIGVLWASKFNRISKKQSIPKKIGQWFVSLAIIPFDPKYIRTEIPERLTGSDLTKRICALAAQKNKKVYLLGAQEGIAKLTAKKLKKLYPKLKIAGTHAGTPDKRDEDKIIQKIRKSKADILFVAYGAPSQELWIDRNIKKIPTVKIAAGIGGTFDFLSGNIPRAPKNFRKYGLEWAYRLYKEPRRIKRIFNATIKFPIKVLFK